MGHTMALPPIHLVFLFCLHPALEHSPEYRILSTVFTAPSLVLRSETDLRAPGQVILHPQLTPDPFSDLCAPLCALGGKVLWAAFIIRWLLGASANGRNCEDGEGREEKGAVVFLPAPSLLRSFISSRSSISPQLESSCQNSVLLVKATFPNSFHCEGVMAFYCS